jgi:outer membrane lipoprotein LolB
MAACSQVQPTSDPARQLNWERHQQQLLQLDHWQIRGRIGLYTENEAWPGELTWKQSRTDFDVRIIASLGAGSLRLYSRAGGVMLERSSEPQPYFAPDPQVLLKQQTGWDLPIDNLRYWVKGVPSPDAGPPTQSILDAEGRLQSLRQSGWLVSFQRYRQFGEYQLPVKVLLEKQDLSVKLVVRQWQI